MIHDSPKDIKNITGSKLLNSSVYVLIAFCVHVCTAGCTWNGAQYQEGATWIDIDQTCSCEGGQVTCRRLNPVPDCHRQTPAPISNPSGKRKKM